MKSIKNYYLSGVMGHVVGDAIGVPVEFMSRQELKKKPVVKMLSGGFHEQPVGTWSDDSSMALATLFSLKDGYNLKDVAEQFSKWKQNGWYTPRGEVFDMGNTCFYAIENFCKTKDPYTCGLTGEQDNGNGSLMRILPICLYAVEKQKKENISDVQVLKIIHDVSAITHAHIRSKMACGLYYYCVRAIIEKHHNLLETLQEGIDAGFRYYEKFNEYLQELNYFKRLRVLTDFKEVSERQINSGGYVVDTIEAAIWCLLNTTSYRECVLKAINLGTDTDTTGAVAGGLAGLYYGYADIPKEWIDNIIRREWIEDLCNSRV